MSTLVPIGETQNRLGGVGRTTVYRLLDEGLLTRVNIGSRAFITGDSIDAYIDSLTNKPPGVMPAIGFGGSTAPSKENA